MIKALMIDVDGVVVTGRPQDGRNWGVDLERDLGMSASDLQREFFAVFWDDIIIGRAPLAERLADALATIAPHVGCDRLISYWFERDSRLDTALLEDIGICRTGGMKIYLATNQEHLRARYLMQVLGLATHVDAIFYSADMGCRKPDQEFFRCIERRTGLDPDEVLLVDDTLTNVEAARLAGWNAVRWTEAASLRTIAHELSQAFGSPVPYR
jgi:putative hydrolase of the HAD superfamily